MAHRDDMMFKVGQKVRIKQWLDMPQGMMNKWGIANDVGCIGIIIMEKENRDGYNAYDIRAENSKYDNFYFEEELEPLVRIGEQLLFKFMEKE